MHERWEQLLTWAGVGITVLAGGALAGELVASFAVALRAGAADHAFEVVVFGGTIMPLLYGSLVYLATRIGQLGRLAATLPATDAELDAVFLEADPPAVLALVPSYCEEVSTVRRALFSAALQTLPNRRVVLLIDDSPTPGDVQARTRLEATRSLTRDLHEMFAKASARYLSAIADFEERRPRGLDAAWELERLAILLDEAADWFVTRSEEQGAANHEEGLFRDIAFLRPAALHRQRAENLRELRLRNDGVGLADADLHLEYLRLASLFQVQISSFERRRYANLPHGANKATNLNAYLDLLGGSFRERRSENETVLERVAPDESSLRIPAADFVLTLDADSVLTQDYASRLVHHLRRPGNEHVAIAQTPYSAFPGAPTKIERLAGATTDIQYLIHQGSTAFNAAYWVGANAVLRWRAVAELREEYEERGHRFARFISDRTVIEDTESTVLLAARGYSLYNLPQRLAFSSTPPDFGSLAIQRRRWADGGLLILPALLSYLTRRLRQGGALGEAWIRTHYLVSIAGVNAALVALLVYPFEASLRSWWLPVAAAPYFALYARDLGRVGYRARDVLGVYRLNLLLVPVNLGGVLRSLKQAVTGRRVGFRRTPKIEARVAAHPADLLAVLAILATLSVVTAADLAAGRWIHASFVALNGGLLAVALVEFIGLRALWQDLRVGLRMRS